MPAGQGRGQFHQSQERRGGIPRAGARDPAPGRGRDRHGFRREGPGRERRSAGRDCRAQLPAAGGRGRFSGGRHHLRPEHFRRGYRYRGARRLRPRLHRGHRPGPRAAARRACQRRGQQPVVLVPRQQCGARGDALGVPVSRHRRGHGLRDRQRRPVGGVRGHPREAARHGGGRDPQPQPGRGRAAAATGAGIPGAGRAAGPRRRRVARAAAGGAAELCAGARAGRPRGGGHRGRPAGQRARAGRDRGTADGRHEHRGRPVRHRQDVPAAGGQVSPGHEEGRGPSHPVHRTRGQRRVQPRTAGGRDGQGRRPRHRQEHRGRGAAVQRL